MVCRKNRLRAKASAISASVRSASSVNQPGIPSGNIEAQQPDTSLASSAGNEPQGSDITQTPVSLIYFRYCITNSPRTEQARQLYDAQSPPTEPGTRPAVSAYGRSDPHPDTQAVCYPRVPAQRSRVDYLGRRAALAARGYLAHHDHPRDGWLWRLCPRDLHWAGQHHCADVYRCYQPAHPDRQRLY